MKPVTNQNIKWQIHAETCITQIMLWIIIAKLFGGWVIWTVAIIFIIGNLFTWFRSVAKIVEEYGKDYFKL